MGAWLINRRTCSALASASSSVSKLSIDRPIGVPCGAGTDNPVCVHNTNETGALDHANSACAASGLNDMDPLAGQTVSQVQTAADSWKYYDLPKGSPGTLGLCKGGTGER